MTGKLEVREELLTPIGNMHGGVLSAFCDHMLGCVCYPAMKPGQWAATTEFKINLTAPVSKGTVTAEANIVNLGRTQAVVRIDVSGDRRQVLGDVYSATRLIWAEDGGIYVGDAQGEFLKRYAATGG